MSAARPPWMGLVILRAWLEPSSSEALRVQIRAIDDVALGEDRTLTVTKRSAVTEFVEAWLVSAPRAAVAERQVVLVVDDDEGMRRLLRRVLERLGVEVFEAADGIGALEVVRRRHLDLVITHWEMPGLEGPALAEAIRALGTPPPVMMVSGRSSPADRARATDAGISAHLPKPIDIETFSETVSALLRLAASSTRARVLVALQREDHRAAVVDGIRHDPKFEVVDIVDNPSEVVDRATSAWWDVMVLELDWLDTDAAALLMELRRRFPERRIIATSSRSRLELITLTAGVNTTVLTDAGPSEVLASLQRAAPQVAGLGDIADHTMTALELLGVGVAILGPSGEVEAANQAAATVLGYSVRELKGQTNKDLRWSAIRTDGSTYPAAEYPTTRARLDGRVVQDEVIGIRRRSGDITWLRVSAAPFAPAGVDAPMGAVAILAEVSAETVRGRGTLDDIAMLAGHDLTAPLRTSVEFATLLRDRYADGLPSQAQELLANMLREAERARHLADDLLDYTRDRMEPSRPVDLAVVVSEVVQNISDEIATTGATVTVGDLPSVSGSTKGLVLVIRNLIENALKFRSHDRAPVIDITARRHEHTWVITVADNGTGMNDRDPDAAFGPFRRHGDTSPGHGLGLTICREIVGRHSGRIWTEPNEPDGTAVRFTIPEAQTATDET